MTRRAGSLTRASSRFEKWAIMTRPAAMTAAGTSHRAARDARESRTSVARRARYPPPRGRCVSPNAFSSFLRA